MRSRPAAPRRSSPVTAAAPVKCRTLHFGAGNFARSQEGHQRPRERAPREEECDMVTAIALALCLSSVPVQLDDPGGERTLHVYFSIDQPGGLAAEQLRAALEQVRQIWRPVGVAVSTGRYGEPIPSGATRVSLRMVSVRRKVGENPILAWTSVTEAGRPTPALFVSVPAVTEFLSNADFRGRPLTQRPQALQSRLLGQVIGRVTAHELGHYLLQRAVHAREGLLRPQYSTRDLVEPWLHPFQVADADKQVMRREVARLARLQADDR